MVVMKKVMTLVLLILVLLTGCELFYPESQGDIYLLSVALSYKGTDLRPYLEGTLPDQKSMREQLELLTGKSGKLFREIAITQDNGITTEISNLAITLEGENVKSLISEAIEKISKVINENDIFIFYYSGHGIDEGLLAFTTKSSMTPDELLTDVNTLDARKLLILDCCYSGNYVNEGSSAASFTEAYKLISGSNSNYDKNLWVMAAALPYQLSWEVGGHGCFTEAFLSVTGYNLEDNIPAAKEGDTISFLTLASSIPYHINAKVGKGNAELEQYPNSTLTDRDLVLFQF